MRRAVLFLLKFALGLACATLAVELGLRVISATPLWRVLPAPEAALYGPDPHAGVGHRPGVSGIWLQENRVRVKTSSLGLRDRERPREPAAHPRTVVTGNSYIEALQVEQTDTATAVAERILLRRLGEAEVVNLGIAGATPAAQMARLKSIGLALKPDIAVAVVPVSGFFSSFTRDDTQFAGYRRQPDGRYALSRSFLKTGGYRFRTSQWGRAAYWMLDHMAVAHVLNSRRNVGLFAELSSFRMPDALTGFLRGAKSRDRSAEAPAVPISKRNEEQDPRQRCEEIISRQLALWEAGDRPKAAAGVLDAFLADLGAVHEHGVHIVLLLSDIPADCPGQAKRRASLMTAIGKRLPDFIDSVDLEARLLEREGQGWQRRLKGFGAKIGHGHLNAEGNRVYGEIIAGVIARNWKRDE